MKKNQALFSSKDKSKKLKYHLLPFLFGALRVNLLANNTCPVQWEQSDLALYCLLLQLSPRILPSI